MEATGFHSVVDMIRPATSKKRTSTPWFSRRRHSIEPIEILGAPIVTLDVASDRPIANLVVRLCDVHPSDKSLRVSYGVLNLTHREDHEKPALLAIGERYRVRIQLNDAGSLFPAGHKVRLAISTAYWPMIWPSRRPRLCRSLLARSICRNVRPTLLTPSSRLFLNRRQRHPRSRPSFIAMVSGLSASTASVWNQAHSGNRSITSRRMIRSAPLPNCAILRTLSRNEWQIRVETQLRMSSTGNAFLLRGSLRAWEGDNEVCHRDWDRSVPRDFL